MGNLLSTLKEALAIIALSVIALFVVGIIVTAFAILVCCPDAKKHKDKKDIDKSYATIQVPHHAASGSSFDSALEAAQQQQARQVDDFKTQRRSNVKQKGKTAVMTAI